MTTAGFHSTVRISKNSQIGKIIVFKMDTPLPDTLAKYEVLKMISEELARAGFHKSIKVASAHLARETPHPL